MKAAGRPISAALRGRRFVAQAAAQTEAKVSLSKQDVQVSRLPNGAVVASLENNSPVSRVAIFYNAGSRFESASNVGVVHCLRIGSSLSTKNATRFGITRNLQQLGASLSCTATREHLIYSLECLRNNAEDGLKFLSDVATSPVFKPWEVASLAPRQKLDLALLQQQPHTQLIEGLHKAAYRSTLGNSLYMPEYQLGAHTPEMLQSFVDQYFTSHNCAIIGMGVDHEFLTNYAGSLPMEIGSAPTSQKAKYSGGEARIESASSLVHAAVVTEGADLGSKDMLPLAVLQKLMGPSASIKYSSNITSSKAMIAAGKGTSSPYLASCLNASYSDSGLFGFQVVAQAADMDSVMKSLFDAFGSATKEGGISDADVRRAKTQLKAAFQMELEDSNMAVEDLGVQAQLAGSVMSVDEIIAAVDKISAADVQAIAKKVINGKPSMAAVGDLYNTPYLDQLI